MKLLSDRKMAVILLLSIVGMGAIPQQTPTLVIGELPLIEMRQVKEAPLEVMLLTELTNRGGTVGPIGVSCFVQLYKIKDTNIVRANELKIWFFIWANLLIKCQKYPASI